MNNRLLALVVLLPILAGCSTLFLGGNELQTRQGASSSLVSYLYPKGEPPPHRDGTLPALSLPLNVGLAFVPARRGQSLSAVEKQALLERVAAAFSDRPFVASIQVIPDSYLASSQGLHGMRQVAAVFGVDAMALVSYDQLALSRERDSALLYWTVVGALVVKGNHNEVHTMIDTAVFDAPSGKLLFRAPGVYKNQSNATLVDDGSERRELAVAGFSAATEDMITNLDQELESLRAAAKKGERVDVAWRAGSGGGSAGILFAIVLAGTLLARRLRRAQRQSGPSSVAAFSTLQSRQGKHPSGTNSP